VIAESIAWYEKMLGFKGTVRGGPPNANARQQVADLRRGNITVELFQLADAAPLPESRKSPAGDFRTHGVKHFGFEVKKPARRPRAAESQRASRWRSTCAIPQLRYLRSSATTPATR
jgi:hypothetical protein